MQKQLDDQLAPALGVGNEAGALPTEASHAVLQTTPK
jgi:hypothetical protein